MDLSDSTLPVPLGLCTLSHHSEKSDYNCDPPTSFRCDRPIIKNQKFIQEKCSKLDEEYTVIGKLGSGIYGDVFKVKHKDLGMIRALKVVKRDPSKKYSQREEIEVLKSLDHPNILKIYEFYELPNFFYIVTELFEGKELFDEVLEKGVFSEVKAAEVAFQILKALIYTHRQKIVHRDIKLQNVLIKSNEGVITIKLIDWGFGSFVTSKLARVCGTPEYAAPDIFEGNYDQKCDIWSFGVLLYVLLSATFPFRGSSRDETISLIEKGKFSFHSETWKTTSSEAKDFVTRLLTKCPDSRPSAEESLKSEWMSRYRKNEPTIPELKETLCNLNEIYIKNNMATAAVNFMTNYLSTQEEKERLNNVFNLLDTNGDGVLSFQEISKGYQIVYGELIGESIAQETFSKLDLNQNGVLEYNEFITYSLDLKKLISEDKMKAAFKLFDSNHDGKINLAEVKELFSYDTNIFDEHKIKNWLSDLDHNGDGEIDEGEFIKSLVEICNQVDGKDKDEFETNFGSFSREDSKADQKEDTKQ